MSTKPRSQSTRQVAISLILAFCAGVASWWAWLSWGFDDDRAYSTSQVIGCGVTAITVVAILSIFFRHVPTLAVPLSFAVGITVAWTAWAASSDDSGMFGVGASMMLVGTSVSLSIVAGLTRSLLGGRDSLQA